MKKVLLFGVALFFVAGLSSCKKDWNCECTYGGVKQDNLISKQSKNDAQDVCDGLETQAKTVFADAKCELTAQ